MAPKPSQAMKQKSISSFFTTNRSPKPAKRTQDAVSDIENQEPQKKRKSDPGQETPPPAAPPSSAKLASNFSYSSPTAPTPAKVDQLTVTEQATATDQSTEQDRLHERFIKRLGHPDSLRRRSAAVTEVNEDDEGDDELPARPKGKGGRGKLTPMEQQYLDIKRKNLDKVILYQVGYKYRFFGEDARIAASVLRLVCIPGKFRYDQHPSEAHLDGFASASFPLVRLPVHVKRLVNAGHKVGVVRQIETAALKAVGDNRNAPFVRKLTNVYTQGTYVDDAVDAEGADADTSSSGYLLCLTETNLRDDEKVQVGIVAVQPATGSIIYDDFEDGFMRTEIETRLLHISPCEYLIVGEPSPATSKLIKHLSGSKSNVFGVKARVEHIDKTKTMTAEAHSHISSFYADKVKEAGEDGIQQSQILDKVHQLSEHVTICLSSMIKHLHEYGLEHVFELTANFQSFNARTHMLLNANTLSSLEIYTNQTDHTQNGSLFWSLNRTKTRFGKRLLRQWVGRPLVDRTRLETRVAAVEEMVENAVTRPFDKLKHVLLLARADLEKILIRIYYKRAQRPEVLAFLQTLQKISGEYETGVATGFKSELINDAVKSLPGIQETVINFLEQISLEAAKKDDKYAFFRGAHEAEKISDHKLGIAAVEVELEEHKAHVSKILGKMVTYTLVAGIDYLIEVDNSKASLNKVPASWVKISATKKVSRFHTPEVIKMLRERDQHKESLAAACDEAFEQYLGEISGHYQLFRDAIQALATLDCIVSLSEIAAQPGYTKPTFTSDSHIAITQGRHPMVEQILLDSYVPNDARLCSAGNPDPSALLVTGPNMGGKSSYVRSIALIAVMAQIGSYVPAASAQLPLLDAVFTRMGAFDNMMRGESTFMVELEETSDILKQATPRSLVILDELGRGTSTHDGVAIAEAVLREMVERGIMTLFITHYQDLARLAGEYEGLRNVHMRFTESGKKGEEEITFLYEVGEGEAHRSYGLNVARLANVPKRVIDVAAVKAEELREITDRRKMQNLAKMVDQLCANNDTAALERLVAGIEQL